MVVRAASPAPTRACEEVRPTLSRLAAHVVGAKAPPPCHRWFFPSPPRQGFSSAWLGGTACRSLAGRCHTSRRTHSGDVSPGSAQSVSMVGWRAATVRACVSRSAASTNRSSASAKRGNERPTATMTTSERAIKSVYAYLRRQARNTTQGSDESRRLPAVSAFRSRVAHFGARNVTTLPVPPPPPVRACMCVFILSPNRAVTTPLRHSRAPPAAAASAPRRHVRHSLHSTDKAPPRRALQPIVTARTRPACKRVCLTPALGDACRCIRKTDSPA